MWTSNGLKRFMNCFQLTRTDIAEHLGVDKTRISRMIFNDRWFEKYEEQLNIFLEAKKREKAEYHKSLMQYYENFKNKTQ